MTLFGDPYYVYASSTLCATNKWKGYPVESLFGVGSYFYSGSHYDWFCEDGGSRGNVAFKFDSPKFITKVIQLGHTSVDRIMLDTATFDSTSLYSGVPSTIWSSGANYVEVDVAIIATDLCSWRSGGGRLHLAKLIALGKDC